MTSTEIIATKLFGWQACSLGDYVKDESSVSLRNDGTVMEHFVPPRAKPEHCHDWPDLTDYNWIRRMEDALWERSKDLYREYVHLLHMSIPADERSDNRIDPMRATAAQRVAAAVKVLEANA